MGDRKKSLVRNLSGGIQLPGGAQISRGRMIEGRMYQIAVAALVRIVTLGVVPAVSLSALPGEDVQLGSAGDSQTPWLFNAAYLRQHGASGCHDKRLGAGEKLPSFAHIGRQIQ